LAAGDVVLSVWANWSLTVDKLGGPLKVELNVLATLEVGDGGGDEDLWPSWSSCFLNPLCFVSDKVLLMVGDGDEGDEEELPKLLSAKSIQSHMFLRNSSQVADSIVAASPNS